MVSKRLLALSPYVPGEQPSDRSYIKLNANESPYPPPRAVERAISRFLAASRGTLARYPDPDSGVLRAAIADALNETGGLLSNPASARAKLGFKITADMIFCGNGSDEVLSFVFCAFFDSGVPLVLPEFTYSFYPVYCGFYGIPQNRVPLKDDWTLDTERMVSEARAGGGSIIFANPNAPTGLALSAVEVEKMIQSMPRDRVFVVDEAYVDFSDETCLPLLEKYDNLIIVRTFSKSMSFAGVRLGYAVASPALVENLLTAKNSFNHFPVDAIAQRAGAAACRALRYYSDCAKRIVGERARFSAYLKEHGWFYLDSKTNFVFTKREGVAGRDVYEAAKRDGILIRHFDTRGIEDFVRITIGTAQQMDALAQSLDKI